MSSCLKIGHRLLDGAQIIAALVQYQLLDALVEQMLLDEAIKDIPLTKQEAATQLLGITDSLELDDIDDALAEWCEVRGVTPEYFKGVVLRELRVQKFKQLNFAAKVESEFLRAKSDFDHVEYSCIQVADLSLAHELYYQLRDDGVDFAHLARQHSLGNEKQSDGWVGPVPYSSLPEAIATLFHSKPTGVVLGPIPVAERFWLVRLEQFNAARLTEATRTQLTQQMFDRWLKKQAQTVINTPGMIAVQASQVESTPIAATH